MFSMTISWTSSSLSVLGPRSRSQWLFLEKHIVIALAPLFIDYTANKFAFQDDRVKVKVTVTVFRKTLQLKACQASKGKKSY